jgi:hypothetical protein
LKPSGQYGEDAIGGEMIIEMRTYRLKPGCRMRFLEVFRTKSMPAHAEIGMKILGPLLSIEDPDVFFFMRGFPDRESREPMKANSTKASCGSASSNTC